jgi:ATP-dependent Clp protease protease subunit
LKRELYDIVCFHSGQNTERIETDFDRDYWMTAPEAKDYGLVDEVLLINPRKDKKQETK